MTTRLNRWAYANLIEEDIAWLEKQPRTLEREHIIAVLRRSIAHQYPTEPQRREVTS